MKTETFNKIRLPDEFTKRFKILPSSTGWYSIFIGDVFITSVFNKRELFGVVRFLSGAYPKSL